METATREGADAEAVRRVQPERRAVQQARGAGARLKMRLAMRLLALTPAVLLSTLIFTNAEEYATTDSGRRVVLRDNGTWVAVPAPRSSSDASRTGSNNVDQVIRIKCQNEWPTDFSMQAYCERKQREGVQTLAQGRSQDI